MAYAGFFNKSKRGPTQMDAHVKTDKLALQAGMRQQHREGSDTGPRAGDRGEILGALARTKSGGGLSGSDRLAHPDSDPTKRHAYGAHKG